MMTGTCICLANKFNFVNEGNREGGLFKPEQTDLGTIENIKQATKKKEQSYFIPQTILLFSLLSSINLHPSITISRIVKANAFLFASH
jgi:hypothetical protein